MAATIPAPPRPGGRAGDLTARRCAPAYHPVVARRHLRPPPPKPKVITLISTNQLKNGNHIEVDGTIYKVVEFQHVKPGKGPPFVRTKLKRAADGNVIDKTFRAGEKFRAVRTEARKMQFLYADE